MAQPLTELQQEYLDFIRAFIQKNVGAPRLDEIANHFGVSSPTARKALEALQKKGYLFFGRDSYSGFYIQPFEFVGPRVGISESNLVGDVDQFGIVRNFPKKTSHTVTPTLQSNPQDLFALHVAGYLPEFKFFPHDILIMDQGRVPKVGDICLTIISGYRVLIQIIEEDENTNTFSWITLDENNENNPVISEMQEIADSFPWVLPKDIIFATALRLTRYLAY